VVAAELSGEDAGDFYESAIASGFRRSHNFVYRPACPGCDACRPVRIVAGDFKQSKSLGRVQRANRDVTARIFDPEANTEQYGLFSRYQEERHPGGGMDRMSFVEYRAMMEESPVTTFAAEFREADDELIAVMLADVLPSGLSAVYSFFDPKKPKRALGTFMILWLIGEAQRRGLPHLYLGYWISGCAKMDYKARFQPLEGLTPEGWKPLQSDRGTPTKEAL
jgi:arginine-tRNA-protein transferase